MPKPSSIQLETGDEFPILYEDRSIIAIDKPRGWMLIPYTWQNTERNLQAAITSSIAAGDFWAKSRNLKFLRNVHRLDCDTSGILLFARSQGALEAFSNLFESREVEKSYLAVVKGRPAQDSWTCDERIGQDPKKIGRMRLDPRDGKEAQTHFRVLESREQRTLVEARPVTGRTHQIRIHLAAAGCPILGDEEYGGAEGKLNIALRAVAMSFRNPFERKQVKIRAPYQRFLAEYGFTTKDIALGA